MTDTARQGAAASAPAIVHVDDRFDEDVPAGQVVGSVASSGAVRLGVDVEARMGVDHGALRIRPLHEPGWGRQGVAYGPLARRDGLALAALVLNGHNASQTVQSPESRRQVLRRVLGDLRRGRLRRRLHFENLAVGWSATPTPVEPLGTGNAFVMHAVDGSNGELWATSTGAPMSVAHGVQNLQILYVVVLRERGAAYYAASVPGAQGLGAHPHMRPLGIDPIAAEPELYAGVQQRILGEVGYRVDTRVLGVRVADVPALATWSGTAHACVAGDLLDRIGPDDGAWTPARSVGAPWADGLVGAVVDPGAPSGLVHVLVYDAEAPAGILFRAGPTGCWRAVVGPTGCTLAVHDGTEWVPVGVEPDARITRRKSCSLQVVDDGHSISVHVDGRAAVLIDDARFADHTGVGVVANGPRRASLRRFEAHPRAVPIPDELDVGAPWSAQGGPVRIRERFDGPAADLDGTATPSGGRRWERSVGAGSIRLTGGSAAKVDASPERPNPGRTVYTVPWDDPGFVDVSVELTPPGTDRHQGHEFRGGVVLWQDADSYVVLNLFLDNVYDGSSISTFYRLDGHEDMYDAVWSLVGPVRWGDPCELRVVSDGAQILVHLDGEPVLHRALLDVYPWASPLTLRRIGIVANEEWGDDTGTEFRSFVARSGPAGGST